MTDLYKQTFDIMGSTLRIFESCVPAPERIPYQDSFVFRYVEKTGKQALVQKLARVVSGLHAAQLLLENGLLQEQAAMQRILDELHEDINFLSYAIILNDHTPLYQKYLDAFYQEEFDSPSALKSTQKRPMVSREKIRAFVAKAKLAGSDPSTGVELSRTINKGYSGYVHGASPHIMDMYGGIPLQFLVEGMQGTSRQVEHADDLWNYFFRSIISFAVVAKAFGQENIFRHIFNYHFEFDQKSGRNNAFQGDKK